MAPLIELYGTNHQDLIRWIRREYGLGTEGKAGNLHRARREEIAKRLRLYRDDAEYDFKEMISNIYEDAKYREKLYKLIPVACEQNVTRRIINEVASLYDKPAVRTLNGDGDKFRAEEKRVNLHEVTQGLHRLLYLCNEVLVWSFKGANGSRLRVVTPDLFDPVPNPFDATAMAGALLDMAPATLATGEAKKKLPHFELWDDTYKYLLNANGDWVDENGTPASEPIAHGKQRIPGVLLHKSEPNDTLLDCRPGRDIISAHLGVTLINIMIMRLSKSQGERQPILQGNLANVAAGQSMDGETPIVLPPEVIATMLETKTDPDHYLKVKREKLTSVAQTYGMSYEQLTYQETSDTTSGKGYQVRREKLTELRSEQRRRALINEAEVVRLLGFDPDGMKVDHSEQAIPQDAMEEVGLLELKMKKGLDSPIAYLKRKDPDLDDEGALKLLKANLSDWAVLIAMVRALNMPADADAGTPGASPSQNGGTNSTAEPNGNAAYPASGAMTQPTA